MHVQKAFLAYRKKDGFDAAQVQLGKLQNLMCSIILNCFTTQHDAIEITVSWHPWSLKINILGTKRVSRKMSAYQNNNGVNRYSLIQVIKLYISV